MSYELDQRESTEHEPSPEWTEADDVLMQRMYLILHLGSSKATVEGLSLLTDTEFETSIARAEIGAYDNGQMNYRLRVKIDGAVQRILPGPQGPWVETKNPDKTYSPADERTTKVTHALLRAMAPAVIAQNEE